MWSSNQFSMYQLSPCKSKTRNDNSRQRKTQGGVVRAPGIFPCLWAVGLAWLGWAAIYMTGMYVGGIVCPTNTYAMARELPRKNWLSFCPAIMILHCVTSRRGHPTLDVFAASQPTKARHNRKQIMCKPKQISSVLGTSRHPTQLSVTPSSVLATPRTPNPGGAPCASAWTCFSPKW